MSVKVDQALVKAFVDGSFGVQIVHENMDVEDPSGAHVDLRVIPNDVTPYSLAGSDETDGVLRALFRFPLGDSSLPVKMKVDEVMQAFYIGKDLEYEGQKVTITALRRDQGTPEDGWFQVALFISYRAFIKRIAS